MSIIEEYKRPWKLAALGLGLCLLILGSQYCQAMDWDVPISFIMVILTYLTAPWSMRIFLNRKWASWPLMLFLTWFSVDGAYAIYWSFKDPNALHLMRDANFPASLSLYGMCGVIWLYEGSLKQLFLEINALFKK